MLPGLPFISGTGPQTEAIKASLSSLEGRWIEGQVLRIGQEGDFVFPDAEKLAELCSVRSVLMTPAGELNLDLTQQPTGGGTVTFHLQWVGGSTFLSHADESGLLTFVFGKDYQANELFPVYDILVTSPWLGEISLMPVSTDLILLQFPRSPAEILVRCP